MPLQTWLEAATAPPLVQRVGISPAIAAAVMAVPPWCHRDPADRLLVATAQVVEMPLRTRDQRSHAAALVPTLASQLDRELNDVYSLSM